MKNTARHKTAPILKRYLLKDPMTQREKVRLIDSMTPEQRADHNLCVRLSTCNPEDGDETTTFFSRGRIRKITRHAARIMKSDPVVFRCGWCGCPTDEDGQPLKLNSREFREADKTITTHGDKFSQLLNGYCCGNEHR